MKCTVKTVYLVFQQVCLVSVFKLVLVQTYC